MDPFIVNSNQHAAYINGDWYADAEDTLYIIPVYDNVRRPIGPDNAIMAALLKNRSLLGGVQPVARILRRWSLERGFYALKWGVVH